MSARFVIEPLSARHDRTNFTCGIEALDRYLQLRANQDMKRRVSNCFVAVPEGGSGIAGYYTLAASGIPLGEIPPALARKLPRYPLLPAVLVGRLAVDRHFAGQSLGATLLYDAIARSARADPAIYALIVDAKDENAASFYRHYGFQTFAGRPMSFYLTMATGAKLISEP